MFVVARAPPEKREKKCSYWQRNKKFSIQGSILYTRKIALSSSSTSVVCSTGINVYTLLKVLNVGAMPFSPHLIEWNGVPGSWCALTLFPFCNHSNIIPLSLASQGQVTDMMTMMLMMILLQKPLLISLPISAKFMNFSLQPGKIIFCSSSLVSCSSGG